ncbi:hypothetical protein P3S68_018207 [Capsicum galapagoense]
MKLYSTSLSLSSCQGGGAAGVVENLNWVGNFVHNPTSNALAQKAPTDLHHSPSNLQIRVSHEQLFVDNWDPSLAIMTTVPKVYHWEDFICRERMGELREIEGIEGEMERRERRWRMTREERERERGIW